MNTSFDSALITNERFSTVREQIRKGLLDETLPSLAVAVARDGIVLWEEAFGWADRENRMPATPHTMYSLASISKPITATGLMLLVERGLVDLDRPADEYLGAARLRARVGDARDATVRRVANHTAGLPLHYQFFYSDEPYHRPSMDETILRYGNLITAPGERFQYSNLGYGILDYIIARVGGRDFREFMRAEVFLPLGMLHASVDIAPGLEAHQALRYGSDGVAYPFYDFDHPGGSAIFCSAHDLLRFGMFHLKEHLADQQPILSDAAIDSMQQAPATGKHAGYGVGWSLSEQHGYQVVRHDGGMGGVNTTLMLIPSERIAVAVLANGNSYLPYRIAGECLAALLPAYRERLEAALEAAQQQQDDAPAAPFKPKRALLGEWRGAVDTPSGERPLRLTFQRDGDVHARIGDQLTTLVNDVTLEDGALHGAMLGDLKTEDANRRPYMLRLDLRLRGRVINGALVAHSTVEGQPGGAPGRREGNGLSFWAELTKT